MLRQRSTLAVAAAKRPRLIPPVVLAAFTSFVGVGLTLMYPYRALVDRVLRERRGDELTLSYLHNLLRTDPRNTDLLLKLAEQQLAAGDFPGLRHSLQAVLTSPDESDRIAARLLLWRADESEWRKAPADSPQRAALLRKLLDELEALAQLQLDEATRLDVAERALELGDAGLALRIYRSIGLHGGQLPAAWFATRAAQMQARQEFDAAAQLYLLARDRASGLAARRTYFFLAVRVWLARNEPAKALAVAEAELKDLAGDLDSLVFMVELARSANRPDDAARYARLMLKLSLRAQWQRLARDDGFDAHWVEVADAPSPGGPPALPFDDRIYTLGYDAFIGDHRLDDAYRVAAFAVRQAPQSMAWRLRLARVAEWSGRPQEALTHWRWLVDEAGVDRVTKEEAAQALLRLAPGLFDDQALLAGLGYELSRSPEDLTLLRALIATYERLGEPEQGIATLQRFVAAHPLQAPMQALADLAERAARIDLAIATLREMDTRFGRTRDRAMKLAALQLGQGRVADAYAALDAVRAQVPREDAAFWRTYGSLALRLQDDGRAREAYAKVIDLDQAGLDDFKTLIDLLAELDPGQAGDLALRAARKFDNWPLLLRALDFYAQAGRTAEAGRVFAQLDPRWRTQAASDAHYLALHAAYMRAQGRSAEALADYARWLALAPDDDDAREGLLWLMVDTHEPAALRALLAAHETAWARSPRLHDALAAAWVTLSAPHVALARYLTPQLAAHRDDFLWLMNYADVLEQDQQVDRAWMLRAYLMRNRRQLATDKLPAQALREARVRLALAQTPGDPALAALRELLRLDHAAQAKPGAVSDELALAWLLARNETDAARSYLWGRYAKHVAQPQWATLAVAMADEDWASVSRMLDRRDAAPSRYDAVSAAQALGAPGQAATAAFESQEQQRDDEPLQLQLSDTLLEQAPRVSLDAERRKFDQWLENEQRVAVETDTGVGLRLTMELGRIDRQVGDSVLIDAPDERYAGLSFSHVDGAYETRFAVGRRESFATWTSLLVSQTLRAVGPESLTLRLGWRQPADESLALRALGWRDALRLDGSYRLTRDDQLTLGLQASRYATQNDVALGSGQRADLSLVHSLRQEARESSAELFWNFNRFRPTAAGGDPARVDAVAAHIPGDASAPERVATLLPRGYDLYGLRWSTESGRELAYSRALRPYASLAYTYNTDAGPGYALGIGFATSLFGADHLTAGWSTEKGGNSAVPRSTRYWLRYWLAY